MQSPRPARAPGQSGFTLIELIFTVTIVAILAALAVPSMRAFVVGQRVRAAASDLATVLMLARSEAIKRNASTVVSATGGDWAAGWVAQAGTTTLAGHESLAGITVTAPATTVTYLSSGRASAPVNQFVFKSTSTPGVTARCVRVDLTGLVSSTTGTGCS
jgi:type IV fimbrial biogenesis protein FimT